MKEFDVEKVGNEEGKDEFLNNIQKVFCIVRSISIENPECAISLSDRLPVKTCNELESLLGLLRTNYILAHAGGKISKAEYVLFLEAIERAKESLSTYNDPVTRSYYFSSFNLLLWLTETLVYPDVSSWGIKCC